jgi:glycosyltransferase involved in cell wall biosynthesis
MRFNSHVDVLQVSTLITTTTPHLQGVLSSRVKRDPSEFHIIPNSIDFNLYRPFSKRLRNSRPRIGWTASDSHLLEGQMIMRILTELYRRRSDFDFVIMGNIEKFRAASDRFPIEWHDFCDISIYPLKLASLELDIGLCPLEDFSFNRAKSCLKWSEYAAMKVPAVCSNLEPYKIIRDGLDGILADDVNLFVDGIERLLDNPLERKKMAQAAFDRNFEEYNLDKNVHLWMEVFERAYLRDGNRELTYKGKPIPTVKDLEKVK